MALSEPGAIVDEAFEVDDPCAAHVLQQVANETYFAGLYRLRKFAHCWNEPEPGAATKSINQNQLPAYLSSMEEWRCVPFVWPRTKGVDKLDVTLYGSVSQADVEVSLLIGSEILPRDITTLSNPSSGNLVTLTAPIEFDAPFIRVFLCYRSEMGSTDGNWGRSENQELGLFDNTGQYVARFVNTDGASNWANYPAVVTHDEVQPGIAVRFYNAVARGDANALGGYHQLIRCPGSGSTGWITIAPKIAPDEWSASGGPGRYWPAGVASALWWDTTEVGLIELDGIVIEEGLRWF